MGWSAGRHVDHPCGGGKFCHGLLEKSLIFSENSRRLWLFPGSVWGFPRKTPGKPQENCWKVRPEAANAKILGFRAPGKANLPVTLG